MNNIEEPGDETTLSPLALVKQQRSHILFVLSNSVSGLSREFLSWYKNDYHPAVAKLDNILNVQHYEQCEHYGKAKIRDDNIAPAYQYMGMYELSLDGAEQASAIIQWITESHNKEKSADAPATWLCYPVSEKVGRSSKVTNPLLVVTFTNGLLGFESDFREWSCTRHIRNALNAPCNASVQCFGVTKFQQPGSAKLECDLITLYEQEGTVQDISDFLAALSPEQLAELTEKFAFPTLDITRQGECIYRPITDKLG